MPLTPFRIDIPQPVIDDLLRRVRDTSWPDDLGNEDWGYGVNGQYLKELARFWAEEYDWRAAETRMNAFAQYRVVIDDVPVHFIREPGVGPAPIPLILTHGWPWTFWDMQKVIRPLADPGAFGGDPADAFDVIVPSLPGFGFSTPLPRAGMNFWKTADLWQTLMTRELGFGRYAAAGGDWGVQVTEQLGHKYAGSLYGIHITGAIPMDLFNRERYWDITNSFVPADLAQPARGILLDDLKRIVTHVTVQTIEPQTISYALQDSPVGLLAWLLQRRHDWGEFDGDVEQAFPREHLLTTATLYWVTKSFVGSARFYADAVRHPWSRAHERNPLIEAPTGITFLGGENLPGMTPENRIDLFKASPTAANYNLHYARAHPHGGHFSFYEAPEACVADLRATFRGLRP